jgi:putative spermidine/putrescine transport system substrate-binding protein
LHFNRLKASLLSGAVAASLVGIAVTGSASAATAKVDFSTCSSLKACGGMAALVKAAKAEGQLNTITLPLAGWANEGTIMKDFQNKYHINITDSNPNGSSAQEVAAVQANEGAAGPDVVDVSLPHAAPYNSIWAPYKVATWKDIPNNLKDSAGHWYADYAGTEAIGCNTKFVKKCPTSIKDLTNAAYKSEVGINNDPNYAGAAFAAVYAAAIANGGSANNIKPGVDFFQKLKNDGNFVPIVAGISSFESGQTPIMLWWDFNLLPVLAKYGQCQGPPNTCYPNMKVIYPTDALYQGFYNQAIAHNAPDPAAARLWEEYLYSTTGQNLFLGGQVTPVELKTLIKDKTVNEKYLKLLPALPKGEKPVTATLTQQTAAQAVVLQYWASEVGDF